MKFFVKILFSVLYLILFTTFSNAQKKEKINPNGYNIFYYPNGVKSSEGYMKNGQPDGYWKTYYPTGILKSEGNRKQTLLDSVWGFYNEKGDTMEIINYLMGKKNGYDIKYKYDYTDTGKIKYLISKELYLNDKKEGKSYYYKNNHLYKVENYSNGVKQGLAFEYTNDTLITKVMEYKNGFLVFSENINRYDKQGYKHGEWKEFYDGGRIKKEMYYIHGQLNGLYKEYDPSGKLIRVVMYKYGKPEEVDLTMDKKLKTKQSFYPSGKIKSFGYYKNDTIPVGVHKEYDEAGNVTMVKIYDDTGHLESSGLFDKHGRKTGKWQEYYPTGELKAIGKYKRGKKTGKWIYYYKDGKIEQKGYYYKGKPDKVWEYYSREGKLLKYETYFEGDLDGPYYQFDFNGDTLLWGKFSEGEKDSTWKYIYKDKIEICNYKDGLLDGECIRKLIENGKIIYKANFIQGVPNDKVYSYYNNGKIRSIEQYKMGTPHGNWQYYTQEGDLDYVETYRKGKLVKINGKRFKWPKELKNPRIILDDIAKEKEEENKKITDKTLP